MLDYLLQPGEGVGDDAKSVVHQIVAEARALTNPGVIAKMSSGWAVMGEYQPLRGCCMLLSDPVVPSLSELTGGPRLRFFEDMTMLGEALQAATGCERVSFAILGESEPALHAHVFPRFADEGPATKGKAPMACFGPDSPAFDPTQDLELVERIRAQLSGIESALPDMRSAA